MAQERTLQQARSALRDVFDEDFAAAVDDQAVERRLVFVLDQLVTRLVHAALASREQLDGVPGGVLQQEPATDLDNGGIVGVGDFLRIEAIQRHGRVAAAGMAEVVVWRCRCADGAA